MDDVKIYTPHAKDGLSGGAEGLPDLDTGENEVYTMAVGTNQDGNLQVFKTKITQEVAAKLLDKWVRLLHLEDWRIDFQWRVRAKDMDECGVAMGLTYQSFSVGQAQIKMLDPVDRNLLDYPYDYEKTLVHELLHLKFAALDDTGDALRDKMTHRMIDDLAHALVDAERGALLC